MEALDADRITVLVPIDYRAPAEWVLKWIFTEILRLEFTCLPYAGEQIEMPRFMWGGRAGPRAPPT
jgi:hypothetical protein